MTTAERLLKIDEGVEKTKALNAELEQTLYGTDTGGKSFYDEFWDIIQNNGKRTNYSYAFAYQGWGDTTFKPKYDIKPVDSCSGLFRSVSSITDLEAALERAGVVLDTSQATNLNNAFNANFTILPTIDLTKCVGTSASNITLRDRVHTIRKLIVAPQTFPPPATFSGAKKLVNIIVEGTISLDNYLPDLSPCTLLSKDSIKSIINALEYVDGTSATIRLSLTAINNAFETSEGAADGRTSTEWLALIATKPNWTISLV